MNIQAPNITSLEVASHITFSRKMAKCFAFKASFLLVFLNSIDLLTMKYANQNEVLRERLRMHGFVGVHSDEQALSDELTL